MMEEGESMSEKEHLQNEIDVLSGMIREREKKLQTMTTQQSPAITLSEISTKNSGNTNSSHSSAKCPSNSTVKPVIQEKKSQASFKTTERVILNSKPVTGSHQPSLISKPTSRANNIFINPKFQNSSLLNRLAVESLNNFDKVMSQNTTQCNKTINGVHVNPKFRSKMIQDSLSRKNYDQQHEDTKIGSSGHRNSSASLPSTSAHSIISEIKNDTSFKEKPGTLYVNPKLIQRESLNSIYKSNKMLVNNIKSKPNEVLMINSTGKQPLTLRNSQDVYQNKSNVEQHKINSGENFEVKCLVKNNNIQRFHLSKDIIQPSSMGSTSGGLSKVISIPVENKINRKIMNNDVHPAKISETGLKNSVPFKLRNSLMNRGRNYAWPTYPNRSTFSRLPNAHYKSKYVHPQLHINNSNIVNVPQLENRCWKKPPVLNSSVKTQTVSTSSDNNSLQIGRQQLGSSLNILKPIPSTSKTTLVTVSRTKIVRKSRTSLNEMRSVGTSTVTNGMNSSNLRNELKQNINQPSCSKTALVAVSRTKVIRKLKNSPKVSPQNLNPKHTAVLRRNSKLFEQRNNKYPETRIDLLRMKNRRIENSYRNVNRQQTVRFSALKPANQQANVGSRQKLFSCQRYKTSHFKAAGLQSSSRLISLSRNKLVREQTSNSKPLLKKSPVVTHFVSRNNRAVRKFDTSSIMAINRNRYSLIRDRLRMRRQIHPHFQSADVFRMKYRNYNTYNRRYILPRNNNFKKQYTLSRSGGLKHSPRKRMKSLTIEGVKYHSSRLKLQRKPSIRDMKSYDKQLVSVRGEKFEVGNGGRTLKRVGEGPVRLNKVYLDGVAFIRSKENESTMLRTNTHNVRHLLRQAKQRSIAQLTKKMRKNNEPCPIFHRFGKCSGKENGSCSRVHDKKHVAVCRRFLRGDCDNKTCLLSHEVALTKMPTCRHFLAGICTRDNCPYLHVKLNNSAPICINFLQGYCQLAEKCKNRHIEICPEYEETSTCSKGKCCPYPHPKNYHRSQLIGMQTNKVEIEKSDEVVIESESSTKSKPDVCTVVDRYYTTYNDATKMAQVSHDLPVHRAKESGTLWLKTRPKIGQLEAFIPFEENK